MFKFFKKDKKPENLKEILGRFENLKEEIKIISEELENLKKESQFSIQKKAIIRYNPFSEVGSNQSFSVALLDRNNDGMVITSLFTREENRVYAKPIKNSISEYTLSEEEKEAISKAIENR